MKSSRERCGSSCMFCLPSTGVTVRWEVPHNCVKAAQKLIVDRNGLGSFISVKGVDLKDDDMTQSRYCLVVQFATGCEPASIAITILKAWNDSECPDLLLFSNRGDGVRPTEEELRRRLEFKDNVEYAALRMRTTRGPQGELVEMYCTNPAWKYEIQSNYAAVEFTAHNVEQGKAGYSRESLAHLLAILTNLPFATGGYMDNEDIRYSPAVMAANLSNQRDYQLFGWTQPVYWLTYLPKVTEKGRQLLAKHDIEILEEVPRGGVIITTGDYPPFDLDKHAQRAIQAGLIAEKAINLT